MPAKTLRVFLIGYQPPGWDFDTPVESNLPMQRKIQKLMRGVDMAAVMPGGWPIGKLADVEGAPFICVGHEHDGKVVTVERSTN